MYTVGWPLWKTWGRAGLPLRVPVRVHYDGESKSLWADSAQLAGFAVSGESLQDIRREALGAAQMLLEHMLSAAPPRLDIRLCLGADNGGEAEAAALA